MPFSGLLTPSNGGYIDNQNPESTAALLAINNNSISNPGDFSYGSPDWASQVLACESQGQAGTVIGSMPSTDFMGHYLRGDYFTNNSANAYSVMSPDADYQNQLPNLSNVEYARDIVRAAANSVDNEAWAIRVDPTYKITIMSIAVAGTTKGVDPPDTYLLRKIANDPTMQNDPNGAVQYFYTEQVGQPVGFFANAPSPSQLDAAFAAVASQIVLRLSQ